MSRKTDSVLFFIFFHELHLMLMDVLQGEGIRVTLLGVKTDRNSLHRSDVIHRTFFSKYARVIWRLFLVQTAPA